LQYKDEPQTEGTKAQDFPDFSQKKAKNGKKRKDQYPLTIFIKN